MKKQLLILLLVGGIAMTICSSYGSGAFAGGAGNHTGSAGSPASCSGGSFCHATNNTSLSLAVTLLDNGVPVTKYTAGKTYRVLLGGQITGTYSHFGFQVSVVKASDGATQAGTLATGGRSSIAVRSSTPQIIEHSTPIAGATVAGSTVDSVSFLWTAPAAAGTGRIRIYAALNAVDFNGASSGDAPNVTTMEYDESVTSNGVVSVNAAALSIYPNPAQDVLHIKAGDGKSGLMVIDAAGRAISNVRSAFASGEWTIDVAALPAGQYLVMLIADNRWYSAKFIRE